MTQTCKVSVITAIKPKYLTKHFFRDGNELKKANAGELVEGNLEIREFNGIEGFKKLLISLEMSQACIYGLPDIPCTSEIKILTKAKWQKEGYPSSAITRTKDRFFWPKGGAVLMLDYDPRDNVLSRKELVRMLRDAVPGLNDVAMLWWSSASSFIKDKETQETLIDLGGQRIYILVKNGDDIERASKAIITHLWAAGYGHFDISKSGAKLERPLFDKSVWQSNRIDFAGGARCSGSLYQDRGVPILIEGTVEIADTKALIPAPDKITIAQADANKHKSWKSIEEEAQTVRSKWIETRLSEMTETGDSKEAIDRKRATLQRALDGGTLAGDFVIHVEIGGKLHLVTVSEILDNPLRYHKLKTLDPLEPDYDGGRTVGIIYSTSSSPKVFSFAHGGQTFKLIRETTDIEVVKGKTHNVVQETLSCLRKAPEVFDFGGVLVSVIDGQQRPFDEPSIGHYLGSIAQYWRWKYTSFNNVEKDLLDPPPKVVKAVLSQGIHRNLKPLTAVVTAPTLRGDGTVLDQHGYDEATGLLYEPGAIEEVVTVPDAPDIEQVRQAIDTLLYPFSSFPFCGPEDRGVMLAALLTSIARPALPTSPAFGFDAPVQSSGKTLLANCLSILATGEDPTVWSQTKGRDDEETRKRIFAALREGKRVMVLDNILGVFDSASVAAMLTSENISDRILTRSETQTVPNRCILVLTGNNLTFAGDMPRRVLKCRIDPKTETPFARQFDLSPADYIRENRQKMSIAGLTIIRGWLSSKAQRAQGRMASFELWDDYIRQTVAWVGRVVCPGEFSDPMDVVTIAQTKDPEQESMHELMGALYKTFGSEPVTSRAVLDAYNHSVFEDHAESEQNLHDAINEFSQGNRVTSVKSLGRILSYRTDRIVGGYVLRKVGHKNNKKGISWRVEQVSE